jgi:tetratricopeptide (TPR) repeat protein
MSARVTAAHGASGPQPASAEPAPVLRPAPLALARAHLRLGSLALARAELEILAGEHALDLPGQVDLAESRWRTGDLTAAGAAASIALEAGEDAPVALAIAAEAAAALGRPNEARRLANLAMERVHGPIDGLFAGMPRSAVWPADPDEPPPTAATLFHQEPAPAIDLRAGDRDPGVTAARVPLNDDRPDTTDGAPLTLGFWDADSGSDVRRYDLPDPAGELDTARAALLAGSFDEAALRFALALRMAPALAPAILEATDGVPGPAISVIRGDAYRQVGLEAEARRAYAAAAWSGARDRRGHARRARATSEAPATPRDVLATPPEALATPPEALATPPEATPPEAVATPPEATPPEALATPPDATPPEAVATPPEGEPSAIDA